ncbi:TPA: hypothetical protein HA246_05065 [Candidatus Woesearchaeota archaeon]|nr:hypothetical protein [Candidatus Woesearchaeota archaeon]
MAIAKQIPDEMKRYAKQFDIDVTQTLADNSIANIDGNIFLTNRDSLEIAEEIMKRSNESPYAIGTFLGNINTGKSNPNSSTTNSSKQFIPSPAFPDLLSEKTQKKVNINSKAEWLFLCGRDVFETSMMKNNSGLSSSELKPGNLVLVQNEKDENLGVGRVGEKMVKNLLDKGSYLRDER